MTTESISQTQRINKKPVSNRSSKAPAIQKVPPAASKGLLSDIRHFFLNKPSIPTLIRFATPADQEQFSQRIMQRTGVEVSQYSVLNLHKIGVEAPAQHVFNELLDWNGDSTCWPNYIAQVYREDGMLERIQILLLGKKRWPFGLFSPLFNLTAIRIQRTPSLSDSDNSRYLLYKCSGGYPIGIFSMFVRSSIPEEDETGQCQLFSGVGFDFYGKKSKSRFRPISMLWEWVHNRVTANTLNRFKQLCEWRFEKMQNGEE